MPTRSGLNFRVSAMADNAELPADAVANAANAAVDPPAHQPVDPVADVPAAGDRRDVDISAAVDPGSGVATASGSGPDIPSVRDSEAPRLPKDHLKLTKFRGDSDLANCSDFLFSLELYIDATPSLAGVVSEPVSARAMSTLLATISGCFPPGSVAAVWFRNSYRQGVFTSFAAFSDLFLEQFQQSTSDLVALQNRWEDASQRRTQTANEYYRFLLQLQSQIGSIAVEAAPTTTALTNKFCASVRLELKRYLQEKRIDCPDYSLAQLVSAAHARERTLKPIPSPAINVTQVPEGSGDKNRIWCFYCRSSTHSADDCRRIKAKKAKGEWQERPRPKRT